MIKNSGHVKTWCFLHLVFHILSKLCTQWNCTCAVNALKSKCQILSKLSQSRLNFLMLHYDGNNRHICTITSFYHLMCEYIWESLNFKINYFWYVFPFTYITYNFCRLDLLPFYARLVATLHPCMSDVAEDLCSMLRGDFRFHVCI